MEPWPLEGAQAPANLSQKFKPFLFQFSLEWSTVRLPSAPVNFKPFPPKRVGHLRSRTGWAAGLAANHPIAPGPKGPGAKLE